MRALTIGSLVLATLLLAAPAQAQYHRQRGAVLGGLTGAAAGALIGDNSNEAGAGAAIGGLVGVVAGSVLGDAKDQQTQHYYAAQQQRMVYQRQYQQQYLQTQAVSLQDVVSMARSGVGDSVIITQIQNRGLRGPVQVSDIVYLSQNGVNENIIRAMQQTGPAVAVRSSPSPVVVTQPRSTVVWQPRYAAPHGCGHHHCYGPPVRYAQPVVRGSYYYLR